MLDDAHGVRTCSVGLESCVCSACKTSDTPLADAIFFWFSTR